MVLAVLWLRRPPGLASVLTALGARDESRQNFVWDLFELPRRRKGHRGGNSVSETHEPVFALRSPQVEALISPVLRSRRDV